VTQEENQILQYLKGAPEAYVSLRQIARRAGGKKKYDRSPTWAHAVVLRMVEHGLLETDSLGHYRIKPPKKKGTTKVDLAPHIAEILERSGRDFSGAFTIDEDQEPEKE
jgi:hypothetical protein